MWRLYGEQTCRFTPPAGRRRRPAAVSVRDLPRRRIISFMPLRSLHPRSVTTAPQGRKTQRCRSAGAAPQHRVLVGAAAD